MRKNKISRNQNSDLINHIMPSSKALAPGDMRPNLNILLEKGSYRNQVEAVGCWVSCCRNLAIYLPESSSGCLGVMKADLWRLV
jgi:hypothetical protein